MVLLAVFAVLVALRAFAILFLLAFIVRPVRTCPACLTGATIPVYRRVLLVTGRRFEWRWCPSCGWQALTRRVSS